MATVKSGWVPHPKTQRNAWYSYNVIVAQPCFEAVGLFINLNAKHKGIPTFNFDEQWLSRWGNKSSFWAMVKRNGDPEYWKGVVNRMFTDKEFLQTNSTSLQLILKFAENNP